MRVEFAENDSEGCLVDLDPTTAAALAKTRLVEVVPVAEDQWHLTPCPNTVGAVRVGNLDVVVIPKAKFSSLLFMIGYAQNPGFNPDEFDGVAEQDLWPLVGETFARLTTQALLRGVLQGYITEDQSLSVLRGRIRVADQMSRRPGLLLPLEVRFDEYAINIPENQILRSALQKMSLVPRVPSELRRRLAHLSARLDSVDVLPGGAPLPFWRPTRLNTRYQPALHLAEIILRTTGLGTTATGQPVASFVVNMATVFESFLTVALSDEFSRHSSGHTEADFQAHFDDDAAIGVWPDVVHVIRGEPRVVFDAKYKLASSSGNYPSADLYQMHTYCTVLGLARGYLVYSGSGAAESRVVTHRVRKTSIDIVRWPLDVTTAPGDLLTQIAFLVKTALVGHDNAPTPAN